MPDPEHAAPDAPVSSGAADVPTLDAPGSGVPAPDAPEAEARAHVDDDWRRVSPKHVVVEVIGSVIGAGLTVAALLLVGSWFDLPWATWAGIAVGVIALVSIAFEPRRVRSIGYRRRADDLVFRRGIMFQRQVAVPYGRMQLVDITRGPVSRALGLADLKFVTAAASTAVTLPGLPLDDAEALRDELVALAETRRAGL
ncbi:PH domain-containing protein [Agromyces binzhouensis]|uniref:PH domain-containing protein n=1 Tax=Agromyces binzhouensis TaxID=1817495 RepID=A0A4Q2JGW5_9MICO|nr:PH domain-containing protein [Agromyces binzhouensis]RXZ45220.1 PH domain-containing protein [Agromyces binzhouensis]